MRVAFNDRDRSAEIILINPGNKTKSYRLDWVQLKAREMGGYDEMNEQQADNYPTASDMLRFSPKQVTLEPGGRQLVKLGARRPRDLANGEYRSHLRFTLLPDEQDADTEGKTGINLNLLLNYTIPVIIRQGALDYQVTIDSLQVDKIEVNDENRYNFIVNLTRSGHNSTFGSINVFWTRSNSNNEIKVAELNSLNFYSDVNHITRRLHWQPKDIAPSSGKFRVVYKGGKEFRGKILAEKTFNL
tara:strand:- start:3831 stop:4562 length:732 start_codon:yes stop_codon:yes gene_type:complete